MADDEVKEAPLEPTPEEAEATVEVDAEGEAEDVVEGSDETKPATPTGPSPHQIKALTFIKERATVLPGFVANMWTPEVEAAVVPFANALVAGVSSDLGATAADGTSNVADSCAGQTLRLAIGTPQAKEGDAKAPPPQLFATTEGLFVGAAAVQHTLYFIPPKPEDLAAAALAVSDTDNDGSDLAAEHLARVTWGTVHGAAAWSLLLRASAAYAPAILAKKPDPASEAAAADSAALEGSDRFGAPASPEGKGTELDEDDGSVLSESSEVQTGGGRGGATRQATSDLVPALHRLLASLTELVGNEPTAAGKSAADAAAAAGAGGEAGDANAGELPEKQTVLYVPSSLMKGPDLSDEAAFVKLAKDSSLVQQLESIVVQWTRQVKYCCFAPSSAVFVLF